VNDCIKANDWRSNSWGFYYVGTSARSEDRRDTRTLEWLAQVRGLRAVCGSIAIPADPMKPHMKALVTPALSSCCIAAALLLAPSAWADEAASRTEPCGKLVGVSASGATDVGFVLRDGEAVDFVAGGQPTHGRLLVFSDGAVFRAYWQPQGSEEKYVLANAGADSVRLVSTPPQGTPAHDGEPGTATGPLQVLSCPKL
jgi:hypothetical protein